jgi:hypothetical protein
MSADTIYQGHTNRNNDPRPTDEVLRHIAEHVQKLCDFAGRCLEEVDVIRGRQAELEERIARLESIVKRSLN